MKSLVNRSALLPRLCIVVFILFIGTGEMLWAQTESSGNFTTTSTMSELLEVGWNATPANYRKSKELAADLAAASKKPAQIYYALSLAMFQQHKATEAIIAVSAALAHDEQDLRAHQFLIWLKLRNHDAKGAASQTGLLAKVLAAKPLDSLNAEEQKQAAATLLFLGRAVGYLEGPLANSLPKESMEKFAQRLKASLPEAQYQQFETERMKLIQSFSALSETQQTKRAAAIKKFAEDAEVERPNNQEKLDVIDAQLKELDDKIKTRTAEFKKIAGPLEVELTPLYERFQKESNELNGTINELAAVKRKKAQSHGSSSSKDTKENEKERDIDRRLENKIDSLESYISRSKKALNEIKSAAAPKLDQYNKYKTQLQTDLNPLQTETAALEKEQTSLQARQKELDKPYNGNTPEVLSLQAKLNAIDTFFAYPMQAEKDRLSKAALSTSIAK